jgi:hypothetical protein
MMEKGVSWGAPVSLGLMTVNARDKTTRTMTMQKAPGKGASADFACELPRLGIQHYTIH